MKKAKTLKEHNRLMSDAIQRYLELCDGSVCEYGTKPGVDHLCLEESGGLCHWCELEVALAGYDYRDIETEYKASTAR